MDDSTLEVKFYSWSSKILESSSLSIFTLSSSTEAYWEFGSAFSKMIVLSLFNFFFMDSMGFTYFSLDSAGKFAPHPEFILFITDISAT